MKKNMIKSGKKHIFANNILAQCCIRALYSTGFTQGKRSMQIRQAEIALVRWVMVCQSNNRVGSIQESMNTKKALSFIACVVEVQRYPLFEISISKTLSIWCN